MWLSLLKKQVNAMDTISTPIRKAFRAIMEKLARPGIILKPFPPAELAVGASKIGGCPDLPPGTAWPCYGTEEGECYPHAFFAQINLADIAAADEAHVLPPTGLLCFFAEMDAGNGWEGSDPRDWGRWSVLYSEDEAFLERRRFPEGLDAFWHLPERALVASACLVPPDLALLEEDEEAFDCFVEACGGDEDMASEAYVACRAACLGRAEEGEYFPQLLGHPDILQYPMEGICEETSRRCFSEAAEEDIERRKRDWRLLFQYSNVLDKEEGDFLFGDFPGNLYFWIRAQDLAARDFSKAWASVQCD